MKNVCFPEIDEVMRPYLESEEYLEQRRKINMGIAEFRKTLPREQQPVLNALLDEIYRASCRDIEEAFRYGFVKGTETE